MIFLDTHIVVWLYQKDRERFSSRVLEQLDKENLFISPIVDLELEYLFETDRITEKADVIVKYLKQKIDLAKSPSSFTEVINIAKTLKWTRDPFDRIITAQAKMNNSILITKDKIIRKYYENAVW